MDATPVTFLLVQVKLDTSCTMDECLITKSVMGSKLKVEVVNLLKLQVVYAFDSVRIRVSSD